MVHLLKSVNFRQILLLSKTTKNCPVVLLRLVHFSWPFCTFESFPKVIPILDKDLISIITSSKVRFCKVFYIN